ncbi:MAG: hypothetical protein SGI71_03375 [Verrucomicrobiota bacterium]|nr:hypothetical protein [Verrucomicrobiota bacterium]
MPFRINLIYEQQGIELEKSRDPVKFALIGSIAIVVLLGAVSYYFWSQGKAAESAKIAVEGDFAKEAAILKSVEPIEQKQSQDIARGTALESAIEQKVIRANLLDEFRKIVPENVQVNSIQFARTAQEVVINFSATYKVEPPRKAQEEVGKFINKFKEKRIRLKGYEPVDGSLEFTIANVVDPLSVNFTIKSRYKPVPNE